MEDRSSLDGADLPVHPADLTRVEEALLRELLRHPNAVCPRNSLLRAGWGARLPAPGILYDAMSRLRKKLRPVGFDTKAERGQGYRLYVRGRTEANHDQ
jgi:DNA-binding response OmpR family regulator